MRGDARRLIGSWRLVAITANGKPNPERGTNPTGLITYHESGWMAAQIQPDRPRPPLSGETPDGDEARAALSGYTAYFGTFSVDEAARTVTHHRVGSVQPGWARQADIVRRYEFLDADRVVLRPVTNANELVWERLKAPIPPAPQRDAPDGESEI